MKYVIIKNSGCCGIAGYVWQVLRAMWHHPNKQYYIDFNNNCKYQDSVITNTKNVWEYYFEQPHVNSYPSLQETDLIIDTIIDTPESEFRDVYMKNPTRELIYKRRLEFFNIINQFVVLKPNIQEKINNFAANNFNNKKVLGIHFRGTDHPDKKEMKHYMQHIKDKAANYDVIFCCTDEQSRFNFLKVVFGKKLICYPSIRSEDETPLHYNPSLNKYQIGEDVLIEAFLMAKTDFLFCCSNSNVNYLARAINPNLDSMSL